MSAGGWIGVDLDGTLAEYHGWDGLTRIGDPIPLMLDRVKGWLEAGEDVRIFTARVCPDNRASIEELEECVLAIQKWCLEHLGQALRVTYKKDMHMRELWDDRAVGVIFNTGLRADGVTPSHKPAVLFASEREARMLRVGRVGQPGDIPIEGPDPRSGSLVKQPTWDSSDGWLDASLEAVKKVSR